MVHSGESAPRAPVLYVNSLSLRGYKTATRSSIIRALRHLLGHLRWRVLRWRVWHLRGRHLLRRRLGHHLLLRIIWHLRGHIAVVRLLGVNRTLWITSMGPRLHIRKRPHWSMIIRRTGLIGLIHGTRKLKCTRQFLCKRSA